MKLQRLKIKNFRLLGDVELNLEDQTTLVVGRNNSGKTSFTEVIRRFAEDKRAAFKIQDFSIECYENFCRALKAWNEEKENDEVRALLPYIEQHAIYERWDFSLNVVGNQSLAMTDISIFYCPSRRRRVRNDDEPMLLPGWTGGGNDYGGCMGRGNGYFNSPRGGPCVHPFQSRSDIMGRIRAGIFGPNSATRRAHNASRNALPAA